MNHDGKMSREDRLLVKLLSLTVRSSRLARAAEEAQRCPECGAQMEFEPALGAYACNNHVE